MSYVYIYTHIHPYNTHTHALAERQTGREGDFIDTHDTPTV